ncbi:MAG: ABC transporter permease [Longimicrobiales bacterium]|jgi:peptide/nickel transport system permease protein|nr:ABC transporter permease [Longimicrobiales bacterium]
MTENSSRIWMRLRRHHLATVSTVVVVLIGLLCLAAPLIAPYDFDQIDLTNIREAPSVSHVMGTDDLGRDLFSRILYGGRVSILIGLLAAIIGTGFGSLLGAVSGYYGGRVDGTLMRFTDVVYSIPTLPLLIVLASYTQAGALSMASAIGVLSWMTTARVVRGEVLKIRAMEYVEAARSLGATNARIIARHVLPNAAGPIVVGATLAVGNAIILESSLSFLGLGVQPPTPTWGNMLMDAQATMATQPWLSIFPGLAILIVVLAVNFLGDGLQDALDPRSDRH